MKICNFSSYIRRLKKGKVAVTKWLLTQNSCTFISAPLPPLVFFCVNMGLNVFWSINIICISMQNLKEIEIAYIFR